MVWDGSKELPAWRECSDKDDEGEQLTPLERFILDNEPSGPDAERRFRVQLTALIAFVTGV